MTDLAIYTNESTGLAQFDVQRFQLVAALADSYNNNNVFGEYLVSKTENSIKAIDTDLKHFTNYLCAAGAIDGTVSYEVFKQNPSAWQYVTQGIVKGFKLYQLQNGFAIGSINRQLSTVRSFVELAFAAGYIDATTKDLIKLVGNIKAKEGRNIDAKRDTVRIDRPEAKKADTVLITDEHAKLLKTNHPDTPQGRKDRALMSIFLDLGLRVSEVVEIDATDIDMNNETIHVYRVKTDTHSYLNMTKDVRQALRLYGIPTTGKLFPMTTRAASERVRDLGVQYGYCVESIEEDKRYNSGVTVKKHGTLSAHDCRHHLATKLARQGLDAHSLMETMGWNSLSTAQRYIESSAIANQKAVALIDG